MFQYGKCKEIKHRQNHSLPISILAPSKISQAQRLKKFSQEGHLTPDVMCAIMSEEKKSEWDRVTLTSETLRKYFPKSYTPKKMQETIVKLLEAWQRQRQREQER